MWGTYHSQVIYSSVAFLKRLILEVACCPSGPEFKVISINSEQMGERFCKNEWKEQLLPIARSDTLECVLNLFLKLLKKKSYLFYLEARIPYTNFSKLKVRKLVYASGLEFLQSQWRKTETGDLLSPLILNT